MSLGGTNDKSNLRNISTEDNQKKAVLETKLVKQLKSGEITKTQAQNVIKEFNKGINPVSTETSKTMSQEEEKSQVALAKNKVDREGGRVTVGDTLIYKNQAGDVKTKKVSDIQKEVKSYKLDQSITNAKKNNDFATLEKAYNEKINNIQSEIDNLDPEADQINILKKQTQIQNIQDDWNKYISRGYITKGKGGKSGKKAKVISKISVKTSTPSISTNKKVSLTNKGIIAKGGTGGKVRLPGKGVKGNRNRELYG